MTFTTVLVVALAAAPWGPWRAISCRSPPCRSAGTLPWGTILINVSGSFLIGFVGTLTLSHGRYPLSETARVFVLVGFCGGFTTFSSFSLQTLDLLRAGAFGRAAVNVGGSILLCLVAVAIGHVAGGALNGGAVSIVQAEIEEA